MKKRIIGIIVAVALVVTSVGAYTYFNRDTSTVFAAEFRDGYIVEPVDMDQAGVKVGSSFVFYWDKEAQPAVQPVTLEELTKGLTVSPTVEVVITENEKGFLITPTVALEANTIYVFDFKGTTWAYKTEADFSLIGTFPRNMTTNVPVTTGIEFVFNYAGADIEKFITIEPKVEGRFEAHDRVIAFVPKKLEEKTIYTVTVKAGLPLENSDKTLQENMVFSFETASEADSFTDPSGYISFNNLINEFGTEEVPSILWNYYFNKEDVDKEAVTKIYAYNDVDKFMGDLQSFNELPYWSFYGMSDNDIKVNDLKKVMEFDATLSTEQVYPQQLTLPEKLEAGFYLVDVTWEDQHVQTFVQVTDLSFYYTQSSTGDLFWLNDLITKKPLADATVTSFETGKSVTSNSSGIARFITERSVTSDETKLYHIQKGDQHSVLFSMNYNFWRYGQGLDSNAFWRYFKSDRSLYKPDDSVEFFGYLKGRYEDITLDEVSVEITQGGYYYFDFVPYNIDQLSFVAQEVNVENGFFKGSLALPNLAPGGYELVVKYKGERVASTYVSVENYIKPSYKIEVEKDKQAIFVDEPINYTIKSMFFEGTPVSYLDFNYSLGGIDYNEGVEKTDKKGESTLTFTPKYQSGYQGEQYYYFSAYAQLPESGSINVNDNLRVFFNDINVAITANLDKTVGTLEAQVNFITLEKINGGEEADYSDFLADPVTNHTLKGIIYRNEWIKTEIGDYYDYINKEVRKQYDYSLSTTVFDEVTLVTDAKGLASMNIDLPKEDAVYYTADITTSDSKDRTMMFNVYFGDYSMYQPDYGYDYYQLVSDKESYNVGDNMKVSFMKGTQVYEEGNYLYMIEQAGILEAEMVNAPVFEKPFDVEYMPNVTIEGVYFNGKTYIKANSIMPRFDYEKNRITLEVITDKEGYLPGDEVKVSVIATLLDANGNKIPVKDGLVNIGLIDEALLALSDQYIDPIAELYAYVDAGIYQSYISHLNQSGNISFYGGYGGGLAKAEATTTESVMDSAVSEAPRNEMVVEEKAAGNGSDTVRVRSTFKDTAVFVTLTLDEQGKGSYTFTLPDNVTSWRLTSAAFSRELQAGSGVTNVDVSLPFFLNTSLSSTYLVGDKPFIGITGYGNDLIDEEIIKYSVEVFTQDEKSLVTNEASAKSFERVNIALGTLSQAGKYKLVVKGVRADGSGDALELNITVVETYHQQTVTDYYGLVDGLSIQTNQSGNTLLTFVDKGIGAFLPGLYSMTYASGNRVDQKYLASIVTTLLNEKFAAELVGSDVALTDYLTPSGGIAFLPYGDADIETTVDVLPFVKDQSGADTLVLYLQNAWYNKAIIDKGAILYGLAQLGEPILYDLNSYAKVANLSAKDKLYVALAYATLGDNYVANKLYTEIASSKLIEFDERSYIKYSDNEGENLKLTAMAMVLTEQLGLPVHEKFYDYVQRTYSKDVLVNAEKFTYILHRLDDVVQTTGSFSYTYNGKSVDVSFEEGYAQSVSIPSATLDAFDISKVTGDLAVIAAYEMPLKGAVEQDSNLSVTRKYFNYQTGEETTQFVEGDIIKVVIDWDVSMDAIDDFYRLTDYVPAGLKPIDNPWQLGLRPENGYYWYRDVQDQRVNFYMYKMEDKQYYEPFVYYARISSLGEFTAEAPIVQGAYIKDSMLIGEQTPISIGEKN